MKNTASFLAGASGVLFLTASPAHAANIRWMGIDMNTAAQSTVTPLVRLRPSEREHGPVKVVQSRLYGVLGRTNSIFPAEIGTGAVGFLAGMGVD